MTSKHRRPTGRRRTGLALAALALSGLTTVALVAPASAAPGGGSGKPTGGSSTSSIKLVLMNSTDGVVNHNDDVTFTVATTATDRPFVGVRCYQGADFVYDGYVGYFPDYMFDKNWFTLGSPYWVDGQDATCTARLFWFDKRGNEKVLTTMQFPVAA